MSPAILLRSGVGPAGELAQLGIPRSPTCPGVGKHLMDHPMTPMLFWPKPGTVDPDRPLAQTLLRYTSETGEFNDMQVYLLGHILIGPQARFGAWVAKMSKRSRPAGCGALLRACSCPTPSAR